MATALIALGSNVGSRIAYLQQAIQAVRAELSIIAVSDVYETAPMYVLEQPAFLNAAVSAQTAIGPLAVLRLLKKAESAVGRMPRERFGPREIDLDLIAYGCASYRFEHVGKLVLAVPHPKVVERRFVLQPLADIAPDFDLPGLGRVETLLEATKAQADSVLKWNDANLSIHGI
jgi:2-amino-4-hydroxy-6-hydroxymethyldihydropteridine diphosphokinase